MAELIQFRLVVAVSLLGQMMLSQWIIRLPTDAVCALGQVGNGLGTTLFRMHCYHCGGKLHPCNPMA